MDNMDKTRELVELMGVGYIGKPIDLEKPYKICLDIPSEIFDEIRILIKHIVRGEIEGGVFNQQGIDEIEPLYDAMKVVDEIAVGGTVPIECIMKNGSAIAIMAVWQGIYLKSIMDGDKPFLDGKKYDIFTEFITGYMNNIHEI